MRASFDTLLSLFEWGRIMGLSPWDLAQLGVGFAHPASAQCEKVFYQYFWQQDFLSREEIAEAIQKAEDMIAQELQYYPAPKYFVDEKHLYPRPAERYLFGAGTDKRFMWKTVQTDWGFYQSPGLLTRTLVAAGAVVTLTDRDGDGINETFTIGPILTGITDPTTIGAYFTLSQRLQADIDETWRVRPINVSIVGGNLTITGHSTLLVLPALEETTNPQILDVTNLSNYAATLDIYQILPDINLTTTDPAQGTAVWDPMPGDCQSTPCAPIILPICVNATDVDNGIVSVDYIISGNNCPTSNREPDRLHLNYVAGVPLVNGRMNPDYANIVAHLATALLPNGKCACDRAQRIIDWWRRFPNDTDVQRPMTQQEINENRFPANRGGEYAWKRVMNLRRSIGVSV